MGEAKAAHPNLTHVSRTSLHGLLFELTEFFPKISMTEQGPDEE